MALKLYLNAKEISESFGAWRAVYRFLTNKSDTNETSKPLTLNKDALIVCVEDGSAPRTGALFAMRSKWTVYSIGPQLKEGPWNHQVKRLQCIAKPIEEVPITWTKDSPVVIVSVHSHAKLHIALKSIQARETYCVDIPCRKKQELHRTPHLCYVDKNITSPKNEVKIWTNNLRDINVKDSI